jgi:hypothetical protein
MYKKILFLQLRLIFFIKIREFYINDIKLYKNNKDKINN